MSHWLNNGNARLKTQGVLFLESSGYSYSGSEITEETEYQFPKEHNSTYSY